MFSGGVVNARGGGRLDLNKCGKKVEIEGTKGTWGTWRGTCEGGLSKKFKRLVDFFQVSQVNFRSTTTTLKRTYFDQIFSTVGKLLGKNLKRFCRFCL